MRNVILALVVFASLTAATRAADLDTDNLPTVLITGSNRGIGLEFVQQLAARGWRIIATARNPEDATELRELAAAGADIVIEQLDVTEPAQISALAAKYAGEPIDLLILNAAKGPQGRTAMGGFARQDFDDAPSFFATNAIGPMRVAQAFMENIKASTRKQIIVISSDSGSFVAGSQLPILYHYKASKAALNMYFHTLAFETRKRGVTTILLHPGMVATNPSTARLPGAMPTADSVRRMLEVIDGVTLADNGRFVNYAGEDMPW